MAWLLRDFGSVLTDRPEEYYMVNATLDNALTDFPPVPYEGTDYLGEWD